MALKSVPTFHDSRYLYSGLLAYSNGSTELPASILENRVRNSIRNYVAQQQRKYLLAERTATYHKIPSYIIGELLGYGLLQKRDGDLVGLTAQGSKLRDLLVKKEGLQVRVVLAASYLSTFSTARYFIRRIWDLRGLDGLQLPEVTYAALDSLKQLGSDALPIVLGNVAAEITAVLKRDQTLDFSTEAFLGHCGRSLQGYDWQRGPKQKMFQAVRRAVDAFMLNVTFPEEGIGRPKYDTLRDRADSFGLVNHRKIEGKHITWEHTYLTSWLVPPMRPPEFVACGDLLEVQIDNSTLQIHEPKWDSIRERFILAVTEAYNRLKTSVGYARVAEVRETVCFNLKLPSRIFDDFIKRLSQEGKPALMFSIAPERYTTRSLPLWLSEGRTYNLIRVS